VLQAADAEAFQALRLDALRDAPTEFSSSYEEERDRTLEQVAQRLAPSAHGAVFAACADGGLVGMVGLARERQRKLTHKAFIWGVFVSPLVRRRGIGRRLMDAALAHAAAMPGVLQVNLSANAANAASVALYRAAGFLPFGLERGFMMVEGAPQDEIHMVRRLHAEARQDAILLDVKPMLRTWSIPETVRFYTTVLGFHRVDASEQDGWARLQRGGATIMLSAPNEHEGDAAPAFTGSLYVTCDGVDDLWQSIRERVRVCYPIEDFPYGMREFGIYDNNGYLLQFGQPV
jgi:RimJ/RimL family protein N-acetyltransferase/catechol 2,3-dioxygenase-like lactoylglutathione lyase family enzyme